MSEIIETVMEKAPFIASPVYDDYVETDTLVRKITRELAGWVFLNNRYLVLYSIDFFKIISIEIV